MFERNDRALRTTRIIIMVFIGIVAVASLIMGIVLAVEIDGVYFLFSFLGWFFCWLMWVWARLYLSYLCDIKLIRNKLYGESNEGLKDFLKSTKEQIAELDEKEQQAEKIEAELAHLEQLLNSGVLTVEEYKKRKEELTEDM